MPERLQATLKRMDELQIAFIAKLGEKVKELSRLVLQLESNATLQEPHNRELLQQIHTLSHSLAGSAGTFKHTAVYNKAKAIEEICHEALQKAEAPSNWHKFLLEFVVGLRGDVQVSGRPSVVENFSSFIALSEKTENVRNLGQLHHPVIVVDDDELLVRLIKEQAKHFEYEVIALLSTADLEAAVEKYHPAAILIDVVFPDAKHSGIEIINQLKAKNKINCPVIFMSNRCDMAVRLDALRAGSDAYIVKPLEILELIRILDRLTQRHAKQKSRILIIDDDPLSAKFYQSALNGSGFVCEILLNPLEAINKALTFNPDCILLDINMPGCNGFELAEVIRQDDAFCHIPILFLTSTSNQSREVHAMKSGGDDFLDKNANLSTLIEIIKGHINRYKELDSVLSRLKKDEVRFRSVTSSSTDAIISVDEKGRIVFWNEGAENIFGFNSLETVGQSLDIIISTEYKVEYHKSLENLGTTKSWQPLKHCIERSATRKDKKQIEIELTYTEWLAANERFYTAIIRDISHRKQIEQELLNKTASLNAIIHNSGEAIITTDAQGSIETANPKVLQLFGYQSNELIGKNVSMLMPSAEKDHHDECMQRSALSFPRTISEIRELKAVRKDGSIFTLELNVSPMTVAGERKFVGILHDISDRKQFVNELLLAKAGAEAASKAKSQFLASMSHELRTPLNAVMGFTQILQTDTDNPLNAEQLELLNYIYDAGLSLLKLISEVLDLADIEAGALHLRKEKFELVNFMNEIITQAEPLALRADLTIKKLTDENLFFVETDQQKLKQVINHLLSNAIKFNSRHGQVLVFLTALENAVRISVADTGKGIPEQLLAELFKPFNRLGAEMSSIEGTGVGLTLTKKLVEMMNGKIGVIRKVGEGTTFWIELNTVEQD